MAQTQAPIIQIKEMGKTFTSSSGEITALDCINLDIQEGEIYGIIGLSGAGKSTLVRCINFLERPTRGSVIVDGMDLAKLSLKELGVARRNIGMIFQQFNLLEQRNALDNVCFPLELAGVSKRKARKRAKELLEKVGLADRMQNFPSQLSGGQKQRVAIARALATNPKVLLCDEATSALDPSTTESILDLIKGLNYELGITVVIITHEMSVVEKVCDRVAIIDQANICEEGEVASIFANPKTDAARRFVFHNKPGAMIPFTEKDKHCYRIIFDGRSSFEPVISNVVLACKAPVNIMYADTRNIEGKAVGQMVIQLPDDAEMEEKVLHYFDSRNIPYEAAHDFF